MCRTPDGPIALSCRPPGVVARRTLCAILLLGPAAVIAAALILRAHPLDGVVAEGHFILEGAQVAVWCIAGLIAALGCLRQRRWRGLFLLWWGAALVLPAGLRELDLQVLVNPENIHLLGLEPRHAVTWKPDWWLGGAPIGVRLAWAAAIAIVASIVVIPFALARYPWPSRLLKLDPLPWLLGGAALAMALAFALDDFIGRPFTRRGYDMGTWEESLELLGGLLAAAWIAWIASGRADLRCDGAAGSAAR